MSYVVGHGHMLTSGRVPIGHVRARRGPMGVRRVRRGPYLSRTPIRVHRAFCHGSSGPVGPYRVPTGFRRNPVLARQASTGLSTVPYRCTIDVRSHTGPSGGSTGPLGPRRDPTQRGRPAGGTVGPRFIITFIGAPRFGRPAAPIGAARATCCGATGAYMADLHRPAFMAWP